MRSITLGISLALAVVASARAQDNLDWPREFATAAGTIVVYQPQPETLEGDVLTGRAAVCVTHGTAAEPRFGAMWFEALLDIDREERIAYFDSLHVSRIEFADRSAAATDQLARGIEAVGTDLSMGLDQLLASLEEGALDEQSKRFRNQAPRIVVAQEPAVLVVLDGPEQLRDLGAGIQQVVNTPYLLLFDRSEAAYYLSDGRTWFRAADLLGPWHADARPSRTLVQLADKVEAQRPQAKDAPAASAVPYVTPRIVVSTEPAELIVFDGSPRYAALKSGQLLYATNTDSELLIDIKGARYYVLLAGRWYRSRTLDGEWTFVEPEDLPQCFSAIPTDSEKAALRAHVRGTAEARAAVLDSQMPETAAIKRSEAKFAVQYDGAPRFEPVAGVRVAYATNSPYSVLAIGQHYYACHNAMWFVAADPNGPWVLAEAVPRDVYLLPPSCPVYPVRYTYIYRVTPEVIYVGYLPGYLGSYVYHGTVIYGTGWVYQPWIGPAFYVPRPYTWGLHAHYVTWNGSWTFGYSTNVGFWDYAIVWGHVHPWWHTAPHPHRGIYEYGGWWGPGGYRHDEPHHRPHPRSGARSREHASPADVYERPDVAPFTRALAPRQRSGRITFPAPLASPAPPSAAEPVKHPPRTNDVLVDRSGNVFRRDESGWKQRTESGWTATATAHPRARPATTADVAAPRRPAATATPPTASGTASASAPAPSSGFRPWATPSTRQAKPAERPAAASARPRTTPPPKIEGPRGTNELQQAFEGRQRATTKKPKGSGASKD